MISFIIIGYNEGWKLKKSIQSVYDAVAFSGISNYEVVYVDSNSTDNSLDLIKEFNELKVFLIEGKKNAAIARNIGAKETSGDYLFYIDGDMQIDADFVKKYLSTEVKYPYFTGQLLDYIYDHQWNLLDQKFHYKELNESKEVNSTGGIFIIERALWDLVGGMKNKFKRSQDLDLSLRLAQKGHRILRLKDRICIHHTIPHNNSKRMWANIKNFNVFYQNSVLARDHLFNKFFIKSYVRNNYSKILLALVIPLSIVISPYFFGAYVLLLCMRSYLNTKNSNSKTLSYFINRCLYHFIKDLLSIVFFLGFYPKNHQLVYKKIN